MDALMEEIRAKNGVDYVPKGAETTAKVKELQYKMSDDIKTKPP